VLASTVALAFLSSITVGTHHINFSLHDIATMQNYLGNQNDQNQSGNQSAPSDTQAQALQATAGYPALMQQYLQQQQQQLQQQQLQQQQLQQQQQAAMAAAGMSGGVDPSMLNNFAAGAGGFGFPQQPGMGMNGPMDATNRLLLQRLQGGQQGVGSWIGDMSGEGDPYAESGILGPWSATSAGLLGKMASTSSSEARTKKVRKKPKDRPKRPLSAYNIFFKEERARILEKIPAEEEGEGDEGKDEKGGEGASRKRKKRPHGKIGFENLAKVIGQRWQELKPEQVEYYKSKASEDMKRYKEQMETYLSKQNAGDEGKAEDKVDEPAKEPASEPKVDVPEEKEKEEEEEDSPNKKLKVEEKASV